jgi:hypothetical protein
MTITSQAVCFKYIEDWHSEISAHLALTSLSSPGGRAEGVNCSGKPSPLLNMHHPSGFPISHHWCGLFGRVLMLLDLPVGILAFCTVEEFVILNG